MLDELVNDLKQVALASVGAVAIVAEKSCDVLKACAKKGEVTVEKGIAFNDELQRKMQQAAQERKEQRTNNDLQSMTRAEREVLRNKLDALDAEEEQAQQAAEELNTDSCDKKDDE